jgi:uncharacterized membrane protein
MKAFLQGIFVFFFAFSMITASVYAQKAQMSFSDVDRILKARCVECHSGTRPAAGFRMNSYKDVMAGGKEGPVIVKGDPGNSALVMRIKGLSKPRMPKDGPPWLSENEVKLVESWIAAGAPM